MIAETMNAVVLTGHGGLDKLEVLSDYLVPVNFHIQLSQSLSRLLCSFEYSVTFLSEGKISFSQILAVRKTSK